MSDTDFEDLTALARAVVAAWRDDGKDLAQAVYDLADFLGETNEADEEQSLEYFNRHIAGDR